MVHSHCSALVAFAESPAFQRGDFVMYSKVALFAAIAACLAIEAGATTVIQSGNVTMLSKTLPDANDLWVAAEDIQKINGFILKPEGMCRDDICIPVRQDED